MTQTEAEPEAPGTGEAPIEDDGDGEETAAAERSVTAQRWTAGIVAGIVAVILVCSVSLGIALLVHASHTQAGCSGRFDLTAQDCTATTGENGFLADWNAVLWLMHGVGVSTGVDLAGGPGGVRDTGVVTARIPLAGGMLVVLGLVLLAGRIGALFGTLRSRTDILLAAAIGTGLYYAALVVVGAVATARGDPGQAVGPAYLEMPLLIIPLALLGFVAGMLRESRGPGSVGAVLSRQRDRLGDAGSALEGALAGLGIGLLVAAVLAVAGMLVHRQDTANSAAALVRVVTSNPFPATVLGTVTTLILIALALPGLALWMLVFGLVVPKVELLVGGTSGGIAEHDLLRSPHDGWLWLAIAAPIAAALLCGYVTARRRRSGTPRTAMLAGAAGGLALVAVVAGLLVVVAATDSETLSRVTPGSPATTTDAVDPLGALVEMSIAASLLLIPGAALGGRLALAMVERPLGLPVLRRWDVDQVGRPEGMAGPPDDRDWAGLPDLAPQLRFAPVEGGEPEEGVGVDRSTALADALRPGQREGHSWLATMDGEADQLDYLRAALGEGATITDLGIAGGSSRPWQRPPRRALVRLAAGAPDLGTLVDGGDAGGHSLLLVQVPPDSVEAVAAALDRGDDAASLAAASAAVLHPGGDPVVMVGVPAA